MGLWAFCCQVGSGAPSVRRLCLTPGRRVTTVDASVLTKIGSLQVLVGHSTLELLYFVFQVFHRLVYCVSVKEKSVERNHIP